MLAASARALPGPAAARLAELAELEGLVQGWLARGVLRLPPRLVARGLRRPVMVEGRTLDPNTQLLLRLMRLAGLPAEELPVEQGRRAIEVGAAAVTGRLPIGSVEDRTVPGPAGQVPIRLYTPRAHEQGAMLVYLHGGGWTYGSLDSHDGVCRLLAEEAGVRVVAVDYRLAPEHRFPAALEDGWAVWRHVTAHPQEYGADPARIAIGGDSAGGNLATVLARWARDADDVPAPALQVLVYPACDFVGGTRSRALFGSGFYLTQRFMDQSQEAYLPVGHDLRDPDASPAYADVAGLAPAHVVVAGFDPLRDEGIAYAERLRAAGVPTELACEERLIHSFANMVAAGAGRGAMCRAADALRRGLA